jgi:hypothetical protein
LPHFAVKVPQKTYSERICFFAALPKFDFEYFHAFRSVSRRRFLPQSGGTIPQKKPKEKMYISGNCPAVSSAVFGRP